MTLHHESHPDSLGAEIRRLHDLALLDELTGLPNRRAFRSRLGDAVADAAADGSALSLVLLDLDGLKDINDTFGHLAGDRALQAFADALRQAAGDDGFVGRIGGDEFAALLWRETSEAPPAALERLRMVARGVARKVKRGSPPVLLSAALGHSVLTDTTRTLDELFAAAEAELGVAKAAPPERVEIPDVFRPRGRRVLGEELRALLAVARHVTTSTGLTDLLRRVARQAAALVGAELAAIALLDEDGWLRVGEVWRAGIWQPSGLRRAPHQGVLGRIAAGGEPELHNTLTSEIVHDIAGLQAAGLRTLLAVPLRDARQVPFGTLAVGNKRGGQDFHPVDVALAQAFADLAATAIENTRSHGASEEARAYQRALMEQARDAILVAEPVSGRVLDANAAMQSLSGYSHDELLTLQLSGLDLDAALLERAAAATSPRQRLVTPPGGVRRKDGSHVPVELSASHVRTPRGPHLLVIVRDVTERLVAAAETLRRNEELEARNAVSALLTGAGGVDEALADVLPIISRAGEVDGALVMLTDAEGTLRLAAGASVPPLLERALRRAPPRLGDRLIGRAAADRTPLVINDAVADGRIPWPQTGAPDTASFAILPLVAKGRGLGVLGAGSARANVFDERRLAHLRAFADQLAVWLDSRLPPDSSTSTIGDEVREAMEQPPESRRDAFLRLALASEQHDPDARGHLLRIERLTAALCRTLALDPIETEEIALASLLHDAGKAALPLSLQRTSGRFTAEERAQQREHTLAGEAMLAGPAEYATARAVARHHHERWDGSGYPDGLSESAIPLSARIVAVADVFDALTTPRGHRRAWPAEEAIAYIGDHAGIHFDPEVAAALLAVWRSGALSREG